MVQQHVVIGDFGEDIVVFVQPYGRLRHKRPVAEVLAIDTLQLG